MKKLISSVLFIALNFISSAGTSMPEMSGHEGNGGDVVEGFFIEKGSALLAKLARTSDGQRFLNDLPVSLSELAATLDYRRISVYHGRLGDSTGAEVDAMVENGVIYLHRENWLVHIREEHPVDRLVFHEMLRSAGVNDDNYVFSKNVSMISDLRDPREAMSLSRYINPSEIQIQVADTNKILSVDTFTYVNNMEMKLEISGSSLNEKNKIGTDETEYILNIPVHNTGETKIMIYRIDYEYVGELALGSYLQADRGVKFASTEWFRLKEFSPLNYSMNEVSIMDLVDIRSSYKENLIIHMKNQLVLQPGDQKSHLSLKRIVVYFNILRL